MLKHLNDVSKNDLEVQNEMFVLVPDSGLIHFLKSNYIFLLEKVVIQKFPQTVCFYCGLVFCLESICLVENEWRFCCKSCCFLQDLQQVPFFSFLTNAEKFQDLRDFLIEQLDPMLKTNILYNRTELKVRDKKILVFPGSNGYILALNVQKPISKPQLFKKTKTKN